MIYHNFAKAFDKVDHDVLLHKLKSMYNTGDIGNWLLNFLPDRKNFVRMPGGIGKDNPVFSGVPQGTPRNIGLPSRIRSSDNFRIKFSRLAESRLNS